MLVPPGGVEIRGKQAAIEFWKRASFAPATLSTRVLRIDRTADGAVHFGSYELRAPAPQSAASSSSGRKVGKDHLPLIAQRGHRGFHRAIVFYLHVRPRFVSC
jgi:hypothetical protein